tara:strand:+ start:393 stop:707 length:315 start_codon:yes stop_codon:yes gene_type:complete
MKNISSILLNILIYFYSILFPIASFAYDQDPTLWVQVPQWETNWSECAIDIPDTACHWYVAAPDSTFGEGFSWENSPWFDANGLNDVPATSINTAVEELQLSKD